VRDPPVRDAQDVPEDAGHEVHRRHARGADRALDERPGLPEGEHVEEQMHDAGVKEAGSHERLDAPFVHGR
jgi:hypothetical protein